MSINDVVASLLMSAISQGTRVYQATTWWKLRAALTPAIGPHRQRSLPHDLGQIKRIADDADTAIRVFDAHCNLQLSTAIEINQALDPSNLYVSPVVLPNCQGRVDHLLDYLTADEHADYWAGCETTKFLTELPGRCQPDSSEDEWAAKAALTALVGQMIAAVLRFGTIGTLDDLHRRVALVYDILARNKATVGKKRGRGAPPKVEVAARLMRLWEIMDFLEKHGLSDKHLYAAASEDAVLHELEQFGLPPVSREMCRDARRATADQRRRAKKYFNPDSRDAENTRDPKAQSSNGLLRLVEKILKGKIRK